MRVSMSMELFVIIVGSATAVGIIAGLVLAVWMRRERR